LSPRLSRSQEVRFVGREAGSVSEQWQEIIDDEPESSRGLNGLLETARMKTEDGIFRKRDCQQLKYWKFFKFLMILAKDKLIPHYQACINESFVELVSCP